MIDEWKDRAAHRPPENRERQADSTLLSDTIKARDVATSLLKKHAGDEGMSRDLQATINSLDSAIDKMRAAPSPDGKAEQAEAPSENQRSTAYDLVDRYLRNNLDDDDYAAFSAALECLYAPQAEAPSDAAREVFAAGIVHHYGVPEEASFACARRVLALATQPTASPEQAEATNDREAHWFALVQGAASEIENAANCLQDPDAKRVAISGAEHYRAKAKELSRRGKSGVAHD